MDMLFQRTVWLFILGLTLALLFKEQQGEDPS